EGVEDGGGHWITSFAVAVGAPADGAGWNVIGVEILPFVIVALLSLTENQVVLAIVPGTFSALLNHPHPRLSALGADAARAGGREDATLGQRGRERREMGDAVNRIGEGLGADCPDVAEVPSAFRGSSSCHHTQAAAGCSISKPGCRLVFREHWNFLLRLCLFLHRLSIP